jgi:hypothetical protein
MSEIRFGDVEKAALEFAHQAGVTSPSGFSRQADPAGMMLELEVIEARLTVVENLIATVLESMIECRLMALETRDERDSRNS